MPVLFIHGVATRDGPATRRAEQRQRALAREFFRPVLTASGADLAVHHGFWGDVAADFAWDHASLPSSGIEEFNTGTLDVGQDIQALVDTVVDELGAQPGSTLVGLARVSPDEAFDLLWLATALDRGAADEPALTGLASAGAQFVAEESSGWPDGIDGDTELVDRLAAALNEPGAEESFGAHRTGLLLREGLSRISFAAARATGTGVSGLARAPLHRNAALFIGDILTYLQQRADHAGGGAIGDRVFDALRRARDSRTPGDSKVVVIAHSMGGNITYDVLSKHRDLECDLLVTVGSQVGLFAELGLFSTVPPPRDKARDRVPPLPNVGRWINVLDRNDFLSFAVGGIFAGGTDLAYNTGRGILHAHSSYLVRPTFYRALGRHLSRLDHHDVL